MKSALSISSLILKQSIKCHYFTFVFIFAAGLLGPLGFAPFHVPGITILSIALFYAALTQCHSSKQASVLGFLYGLGYFGLGISWVIISIHDYGNIHYILAGMATLAFVMYLAFYPALVGYLFKRLELAHKNPVNMLLFSVLWCFSEFLRATLLTGFPWLIIGNSHIDTPLRYLYPFIGIYGVSLLAVLASTFLASAIYERTAKRYFYIAAFTLILISPSLFKNINWTTLNKKPVSVGMVQANLAMRDKWDEDLFWNLLKYYEKNINALLGKQLIILPESAIPLPASYLEDYLLKLQHKTLAAKSALLLGILQATDDNEIKYQNAMISLGAAHGEHIKRQLVPFGEYIPLPFVALNQWLGLPLPNVIPGKKNQKLITIAKHPIASLICYEIAYPELLRQQMPRAQWIVSISDNGWFGHSLASYQQLQMAQVLAALTGRYHIVVNNDGLSSIINNKGDIVESLPAFSPGILQGDIAPAQGTTPWIEWGNYPLLMFCLIMLIFIIFLRLRQAFTIL